MNLRKLFSFLNKKKETLSIKRISKQFEDLLNDEIDLDILQECLKMEEFKNKIEYSIANYIVKHKKYPNIIVINSDDFKYFKHSIEKDIYNFTVLIDGRIMFRDLDVIQTPSLEKGAVFCGRLQYEAINI